MNSIADKMTVDILAQFVDFHLGESDKRVFCFNSVPHQALQASPDSENLFYYHDEMNGESPPVITTGQKDSIVPASVSDIRIYGNSENYF